MVVAYLRGLLKPSFEQGLRSRIAERAVLEALAADESAKILAENIRLDHILMPLLDEKSRNNIADMRGLRLTRVGELRSMDIYAFSRSSQYANLVAQTGGQEISLVQLAHAMEKSGLLNLGLDGDKDTEKEDSKPEVVKPVSGDNMSDTAKENLGLN